VLRVSIALVFWTLAVEFTVLIWSKLAGVTCRYSIIFLFCSSVLSPRRILVIAVDDTGCDLAFTWDDRLPTSFVKKVYLLAIRTPEISIFISITSAITKTHSKYLLTSPDPVSIVCYFPWFYEFPRGKCKTSSWKSSVESWISYSELSVDFSYAFFEILNGQVWVRYRFLYSAVRVLVCVKM
jgi:hypothetical protein